jgi:hypothetical protein
MLVHTVPLSAHCDVQLCYLLCLLCITCAVAGHDSNLPFLTNFMEPSPSWEAANCAATQELPSNSWYPKVYYGLQKSPPRWSLSWARSIQSTPTYPSFWRSILILSTNLSLEFAVPTPFNDTNNLLLVNSSLKDIDDVIRLYWEVTFLAVTEHGNITKT